MTKVKKLLKKAFTLVELVVVVAIIAILSGVSVAAYVGITDRANKAADQDEVAQLNLQLAAQESVEGKNKSCYDAVADCISSGLNIEEMKPNTKNCEYVWDEINDRFGIMTDKGEVLTEDSTLKLDLTKKNKIWRLSTVVPATSEYPIYLRDGFAGSTITGLNFGLDTGFNEGISSIEYTGSSDQGVTIRTGSMATTLSINGSDQTVISHYGNAGIVKVNEVAYDSYHEYGRVGRIELKKGHVSVEPGAYVYRVEAEASNCYVSKALRGVILDNYGDEMYGELSSVSDSTFTTKALLEGDGFCQHLETERIYAGKHAYEICKICGYGLVEVFAEAKDDPEATEDIPQKLKGYIVVRKRVLKDTNGSYQCASLKGFNLKTIKDITNYKNKGFIELANDSVEPMFTNTVMNSEQLVCSHEHTHDIHSTTEFAHTVVCEDCGYQYAEFHDGYCTEHNWNEVTHNCEGGNCITKTEDEGGICLCGSTLYVWGNPTSQSLFDLDATDMVQRLVFANDGSVTEIVKRAFSYLSNLISVEIPEGITNLNRGTFKDCFLLESVTLPSTIESIGIKCFESCYSLRNIVIPKGVTVIEYEAFINCESLENIVIPSTINNNSLSVDVFYDVEKNKDKSVSKPLEVRFNGTIEEWKNKLYRDSEDTEKDPSSYFGYTVRCSDGIVSGEDMLPENIAETFEF